MTCFTRVVGIAFSVGFLFGCSTASDDALSTEMQRTDLAEAPTDLIDLEAEATFDLETASGPDDGSAEMQMAKAEIAEGKYTYLCDRAARWAEHKYGIGADMMRAITRVETFHSKTQTPWPWTLNIAGKPAYYESRKQMVSALKYLTAQGKRNIDVGCFQVNMRWHAKRFENPINDLTDPFLNARYAAQHLQELRKEGQSWTTAVGYYHTRKEARARQYRCKVVKEMLDLRDQPASQSALDHCGKYWSVASTS